MITIFLNKNAGNFEVFRQYSAGSPSGKLTGTAAPEDANLAQSSFGFDMIGGDSLHSSQFDATGTQTGSSGRGRGLEREADAASNLDSSLDSSSHY